MSVGDLNISPGLRDKIKLSISNYRRAGIDIEIIDEKTVKIIQARLLNGYILNTKQLYDRAKEVFAGCDVKIVPVVYSFNADDVTPGWINDKMIEFGIHRNDLIKQLVIDKARLSLYLSGGRGLTHTAKAAFYYYFLTYELNRDLRDNL